MNNKFKASIYTSYIFGAPAGLVAILTTFLFVTKDSNTSIFVLKTMGYSVISLIVAFLISLRIGAKVAYNLFLQRKSLFYVSICYSAIVNLTMWLSFMIVQIIHDSGLTVFLRVPVIGFIFCFPFSIVTIGLLISYKIKKNAVPFDIINQ